MRIKFWGTRGSIPTPLTTSEVRQKISRALQGAAGLDLSDESAVQNYVSRLPLTMQGTIGGDTTCVEIESGGQQLILDAGSGLRRLGLQMMANGAGENRRIDLLISHTHWDHIHGFPFFVPAFIPGNNVTFHSPFPDLAHRLTQQQDSFFFPVDMDYMQADFDFVHTPPETWTQIGRFKIYPIRLSHPGETYGFRIEDGQRCFVFASDSEYKRADPASTERIVDFFHHADLLAFDAQYTWAELQDKPDWGHSSAITGAEMAYRAGVKRLALTHHDPTSSDEKIWSAREQAEGYLAKRKCACEALVAYDGLSLEF